MNKKTGLYAALFVGLLIFAWFLVKSDKQGSMASEEAALYVTDTASVDKIFMADRKGNSVTLTRSSEGWVLNNDKSPRPDAIQTLLSTLRSMRVRYPVPQSAYNGVIKDLSSLGVKVEVFLKGEKAKTFYVGSYTPDMTGTYMMLEDAKLPYVVYIPGFNGYLSTRFFTDENDWRERVVMAYSPEQIQSVEVDYPDTPAYSFKIQAKGNAFAFYQNGQEKATHPGMLNAYLQYFRKVVVEGFDKPTRLNDSIRTQGRPRLIFRLHDRKGKVRTLNIYKKYQFYHPVTLEPGPIEDLDREFYWLKETNDFGTIQFFSAAKMYRKADDFLVH